MAVDEKFGRVKIDGIPDDEPIFILRGKDTCTPQTINMYAENANRAGSPSEHTSSARRVASHIAGWQLANKDRVKTPD